LQGIQVRLVRDREEEDGKREDQLGVPALLAAQALQAALRSPYFVDPELGIRSFLACISNQISPGLHKKKQLITYSKIG
jgi:hypothetical protein